jgi:hypothetical protein
MDDTANDRIGTMSVSVDVVETDPVVHRLALAGHRGHYRADHGGA